MISCQWSPWKRQAVARAWSRTLSHGFAVIQERVALRQVERRLNLAPGSPLVDLERGHRLIQGRRETCLEVRQGQVTEVTAGPGARRKGVNSAVEGLLWTPRWIRPWLSRALGQDFRQREDTAPPKLRISRAVRILQRA